MMLKLLFGAMCIFFLPGSGQLLQAQSKEYIYVDSSLLYDQQSTDPQPEPESQGSRRNYIDNVIQYTPKITDTNLVKNKLSLSADSMELLKHHKNFAYASKMDSLLKDLQQKEIKAANDLLRQKPSLLARVLASKITQFFFWMLACVFLSVILYKLFFTQGIFQRSGVRQVVALATEDDTAHFSSIDYIQKSAHANEKGNFRLAVRYLYLSTLQVLCSKGTLVFSKEKTNAQYVAELRNTPYVKDFFLLTLTYEYIWYGQTFIDEDSFTNIEKKFRHFRQQINLS